MHRLGLDRAAARRRLAAHGDNLRAALGETRRERRTADPVPRAPDREPPSRHRPHLGDERRRHRRRAGRAGGSGGDDPRAPSRLPDSAVRSGVADPRSGAQGCPRGRAPALPLSARRRVCPGLAGNDRDGPHRGTPGPHDRVPRPDGPGPPARGRSGRPGGHAADRGAGHHRRARGCPSWPTSARATSPPAARGRRLSPSPTTTSSASPGASAPCRTSAASPTSRSCPIGSPTSIRPRLRARATCLSTPRPAPRRAGPRPTTSDGRRAARGQVDATLVAELLQAAVPPPTAAALHRPRGLRRGLAPPAPRPVRRPARGGPVRHAHPVSRRREHPRQLRRVGPPAHPPRRGPRLRRRRPQHDPAAPPRQQLFTPTPVRSTGEVGLDPNTKEAVAFAILANETLFGLPGNLPSATGARGPRVLGKLVL